MMNVSHAEWFRRNIVRQAKAAQVEASSELVAGLREMVNNPAFSDVVFLCNDGEQVRASRMLLAGRSDVLKSMLMNGMAESNRCEIKLEVSSPVMLSVLEFLYTGTMLSYFPESWSMGWKVIIAAQFFLLPKLEIIVRKFVLEKIYNAAEDLPGVATMLTEAVGVEGFCDQADELSRKLVDLLSSNWSCSGFVQNLSEDAFCYLLANSCRHDIEDVDIFAFREYLRFRQVIQWWLYRINLGPHRIEELMSCLAPDKERVWSILGHPENEELDEEEEAEAKVAKDKKGRCHLQHVLCDWNALQSNQAAKIAAMRMLSNIDYRLIHPVILAKVVEPLEISCLEDLNAFRFHALRSPLASLAGKMPQYIWKHSKCYGTVEHGHVIYRTGTTSGLAVLCNVDDTIGRQRRNMMLDKNVSEWEFILGEECSLFAELGLVFFPPVIDDSRLCSKLSDCTPACVVKSNGMETVVSKEPVGRHIAEGQAHSWDVLLEYPLYEGSKVSFIFDKRASTCSVSINGRDFGILWKELRPDYLPAVSFGNCRPGHMSIKLVRGF